MKRREFIALVGGAIGSPLAARAQPMPVLGFLHLSSAETTRQRLAAFHQGLGDAGYVAGRNVAIEYRWAQDQNDRMAGLISELVRQKVSVIVVLESTNGALAAKRLRKPSRSSLCRALTRSKSVW
jgi:putative ABC transport system substrate-binding protein